MVVNFQLWREDFLAEMIGSFHMECRGDDDQGMKMVLPAEVPQSQDIGQSVVGLVFNDNPLGLQNLLLVS